MRRGASVEADKIKQFSPLDRVIITYVNTGDSIEGVVTEVNAAENMVYVSWAGGEPRQHTPSELQLQTKYIPGTPESNAVTEQSIDQMAEEELAARRGSDVPSGFVGDPKDHGMDSPISNGYSIMRDLVDQWRKKEKVAGEAGELLGYMCRRGAYHKMRGRYYRRTRAEVEESGLMCPRCKAKCDIQPFTKSVKLWSCPECGWKIPSDRVVDTNEQLPVME